MYLDIFLILIIAITMFFGYRKGFLLEIFSFVGVVVAVLATKNLTPKFFKVFSITVDKEDRFNYALSYFIVFCLLYLAIVILTYFLKKMSQGGILGFIDKLVGGAIGLFKGLIISLIMLISILFFSKHSKKIERFSEDSYIRKYFLEYSVKFEGVLPQEIKKMLEESKYQERIKKYLDEI